MGVVSLHLIVPRFPYICIKHTLNLYNLVIVTDAICIQSSATRSPCYYRGIGGPVDWYEAQNICKKDNAYLAVLLNSAKHEALVRMLGRRGKCTLD